MRRRPGGGLVVRPNHARVCDDRDLGATVIFQAAAAASVVPLRVLPCRPSVTMLMVSPIRQSLRTDQTKLQADGKLPSCLLEIHSGCEAIENVITAPALRR